MAVSQRVAIHVSKSLMEALKDTSAKRSYPAAVIIKNAVLWYSQNPNALPSLNYPGNLESSISVRLNEDLIKLVEENRSARSISTYLRNALECYLPVLNNPDGINHEIRPSPQKLYGKKDEEALNKQVKSLYDMNIIGF